MLSFARKAASDRNGAITGLGPEVFKVRAHLDTLDRVGTVLNGLVYNALARGYRFEQGREGLDMVVDDEAIGFIVYQTIRRSLHVATEEETRRLERWDARHRNDWDSWLPLATDSIDCLRKPVLWDQTKFLNKIRSVDF